jgi:predicted ATPase
MRVKQLSVGHWRNFEGVSVEVPKDANLVCLIGENGTGKSNMLELVATAAHTLGLSAGLPLRRGSPTGEPHEFSVTIEVSESVVPRTAALEAAVSPFEASLPEWDGTLTFFSQHPAQARFPELGPVQSLVMANGIADPPQSSGVGARITVFLQQRQEVNHLYMDADRAFSQMTVQDQELWSLVRQDMKQASWLRGQASQLTQNMYVEWLKALLAQAIRGASAYQNAALAAHREGRALPEPTDEMAGYRESIQRVLPHLSFKRLDEDQRTIVFDSAGTELTYQNLSGGEREIAFLVGQIERFQLRRGLLLIDEPELHLNAELLRNWLVYMRDSMEEGQVWIATHALEAVEVAGTEASLLLERSEDRLARSVTPLSTRPALETLAGAVGSPAFSLERARFVLIEGDRPGRERSRFAEVCGDSDQRRFVEAGNCNDVIRRLDSIRHLAKETDQLRVGGVIDRDFRTHQQVQSLENQSDGLFVLGCHEIENFFLHPGTLEQVLQQLAHSSALVTDLLQQCADPDAGRWVVDRTTAQNDRPGLDRTLRDRARQTSWSQIEPDLNAWAGQLAALEPGLGQNDKQRLEEQLGRSAEAYRDVKGTHDFWKECFGKETLKRLSTLVELTGSSTIERLAAKSWGNGTVDRPQEAEDLRGFVDGLQVAR